MTCKGAHRILAKRKASKVRLRRKANKHVNVLHCRPCQAWEAERMSAYFRKHHLMPPVEGDPRSTFAIEADKVLAENKTRIDLTEEQRLILELLEGLRDLSMARQDHLDMLRRAGIKPIKIS